LLIQLACFAAEPAPQHNVHPLHENTLPQCAYIYAVITDSHILQVAQTAAQPGILTCWLDLLALTSNSAEFYCAPIPGVLRGKPYMEMRRYSTEPQHGLMHCQETQAHFIAATIACASSPCQQPVFAACSNSMYQQPAPAAQQGVFQVLLLLCCLYACGWLQGLPACCAVWLPHA